MWIDSQTEEEIYEGSVKQKICPSMIIWQSAYLRAKEDYLMGINFSRLLTLKYGNSISNYLDTNYSVVSVGRVMTCVLGMVVRENARSVSLWRRHFTVCSATIGEQGQTFEGEWRAVKGSRYFESFDLYKENGFKERKKTQQVIQYLTTITTADLSDRVY